MSLFRSSQQVQHKLKVGWGKSVYKHTCVTEYTLILGYASGIGYLCRRWSEIAECDVGPSYDSGVSVIFSVPPCLSVMGCTRDRNANEVLRVLEYEED